MDQREHWSLKVHRTNRDTGPRTNGPTDGRYRSPRANRTNRSQEHRAIGADGIACWDLNGNGVRFGRRCEWDGSFDALDCQGSDHDWYKQIQPINKQLV